MYVYKSFSTTLDKEQQKMRQRLENQVNEMGELNMK